MQIVIEKANATFDVDFEALPANSQARVIAYGLKQLLNDATAPISLKRDGEPLRDTELNAARKAAKELAAKRLDNLERGILTATRVGRAADRVSVIAREIATARVKASKVFTAWLSENQLKVADKAAREKLSELAAKLAQREDIVAMAFARAAEEADLDIGDLDVE